MPGRGHIFIADTFLACDSYREVFERHWCAQIGTIAEYVAAAHEAGFAAEMIEDVSFRATNFWSRTLALMQLEAHDKALTRAERAKLDESCSTHALVQRGLINGGLCHALMSFTRR